MIASDADSFEPPADTPLSPAVKPLIAWLVILLIVPGVVWLQSRRPASRKPSENGGAESLVMELQGKYLVGAADLFPQQPAQLLYEQAETLNSGPVGQRLRFITLAGELAGHTEARKQLDQLDETIRKNAIELPAAESRAREILNQVYAATPSLITAADSAHLEQELGWFGQLALHPKGAPEAADRERVMQAARRLFGVLISAIVAAGLIGMCGLAGLIALFGFAIHGHVHDGLEQEGRPLEPAGIYAETFAVWMVMFPVLGAAAAVAPARWWLPATMAASLLSLLALAWPVWRGLPWLQVRRDIGLTSGRGLVRETLIGFGCYAMTIPLTAIGVAVMLGLMYLQSRSQVGPAIGDFETAPVPSHPIVPYLAQAGWLGRVQIVILASVLAPLVEETMFRGVLFRHVRGATTWLGGTLSLLLSAAVCGLVFAAVHPQGLIAIPALMGVSFGLSIARQWRGTLIPGMVAHGLHNGLMMLIVMAALG